MPPSGETLQFPFPIKGMDEFWSSRKQPILSTPDCLNVRAAGTFEGRRRGGKRDGLAKLYADQLGSSGSAGRTFRMLGEVAVTKAADTYAGTDEDNFNRADSDNLGTGWTAGTWGDFTRMSRIGGQFPGCSNKANDYGWSSPSANIRKALGFDSSTAYTIGIDIYPSPSTDALNGGWNKCRKYLYARMDDTTPNVMQDGVYAWIEIAPKVGTGADADLKITYTGALVCMVGGVVSSSTAFTAGEKWKSIERLPYTMTVDGDTITVKLDGETICTRTVATQTGQRVGFGSQMLGVYSDPMDNWRVSGCLVTGEPVLRHTKLVAACGGKTYYESQAGTLTELTGAAATVSDAHSFMGAAHGNSFYIADYGSGYNPKVYDATADTISDWTATTGNVPTQCELITLWRNRIVLAHDTNWYMSRVDDPLDWDYTQTDAAAAVSGSATTKAGKPGIRLTALISWSDDTLIFAGRRALLVLSGDPNYGGQIDAIPTNAGVVDKQAWCYSPSGDLYYFSEDGLYRMSPHGQPENISAGVLPSRLSHINTEVYEVILAWSRKDNGVMIFVTSRGDGESVHYFYDVLLGGFWRDQYPNDHGPTAVLDYSADTSTYRHLLMGGRDGYIRYFQEGAKSDDSTAIESYVVFAPQRMTRNEGWEGLMQSLWGAFANETDYVDYEIRVADTSEYAWRAVARESGRWRGGGLKEPIRTRVRGGSVAIRLGSTSATSSWACEKIFAFVKRAGMARMGQGAEPIHAAREISSVPAPSFSEEPSSSDLQDSARSSSSSAWSSSYSSGGGIASSYDSSSSSNYSSDQSSSSSEYSSEQSSEQSSSSSSEQSLQSSSSSQLSCKSSNSLLESSRVSLEFASSNTPSWSSSYSSYDSSSVAYMAQCDPDEYSSTQSSRSSESSELSSSSEVSSGAQSSSSSSLCSLNFSSNESSRTSLDLSSSNTASWSSSWSSFISSSSSWLVSCDPAGESSHESSSQQSSSSSGCSSSEQSLLLSGGSLDSSSLSVVSSESSVAASSSDTPEWSSSWSSVESSGAEWSSSESSFEASESVYSSECSWTPGSNACGGCDPALPDTIYLTWSGLAGDFAGRNGKTVVTWSTGCSWDQPGAPALSTKLWYASSPWYGKVENKGTVNCSIKFAGNSPTGNCDPFSETYSYDSCTATACTDTNSCTDSSASLTVSWI